MSAEFGIWRTLTRVVVFLFVVALLLVIGQWYLPLIKQNEFYRRRNMELEAQIQQEKEAARGLETAIDALRQDPKAVERLARERLGYARPGEIVVRFEGSATNPAPVR